MMSFAELNARYLAYIKRERHCYEEYQRIYNRDFADWSEHPTKHQLILWNRDNSQKPSHANKRLVYLKGAYNWAMNELDSDGQPLWPYPNPAAGIKAYRTFSRERTMTHAECRLLVASLDLIYPPFSVMLTVLLTTGCRVGEAIRMEWANIDLEAGYWLKPTTKNGRPQRVPLPRQTCTALATMPRTGQWVFEGCYERHLTRNAVNKLWGRTRKILRMHDVRIHDFRRTVASRLLDQGCHDRIIKAILNHYNGDVTSIYARASFEAQSQALQQHADALFSDVSHASDNGSRTRSVDYQTATHGYTAQSRVGP